MNEVKLPRLGQGMESGAIVRWLKAEGDPIERGEPLYELDTEKVTQEVEAEVSGVLLKIVVQEGEVEVGRTVAWIGETGEEVPAISGEPEIASRQPQGGAAGQEEERPREPVAAPPSRPGRVKASPLARRVAREQGIDLAAIAGTGPDGRIVADDVERSAAGAAPAPPAAPAPAPEAAPAGEVERVPLTQLRKTVARRMTEAWEAPAFQITMSADMTRALELRARLVERHPEEKPTLTDVLTKVCALALMRHREVNALFAGDAVELHPSANIGIAVATERGLVVPVIPGCERRTVSEIAAARVDLVSRARDGKLRNADFEGGTFTISNLGMFGVGLFTAVLNPPQAAILAVGAVEERAVVRAGGVVVRPLLAMTLTSDHRAIDGATAAEFLRTVRELLEEPGLAL